MKPILTAPLLFLTLVFAIGLTYAAPGVLMCHVTDPLGKPVVGATVYLTVLLPGAAPKILTTDADGAFTVDASTADTSTMNRNVRICMVVAKGFGAAGIILHGAQDYHLQLPQAATVTGKVVDGEGKPITGAQVFVEYAVGGTTSPTGVPDLFGYFAFEPLKDLFSTKTDANGAYSIAGLPAGTAATVVLTDPNYVNANAVSAQGGNTVPAIVAVPGTSISGKVSRPDGKPCPSLQIQFMPTDMKNGFHGAVTGVHTDATGHYTIPSLMPGSYYIDVQQTGVESAPDWAPPPPVTVDAEVGKPGIAPDLILTNGSLVTGEIDDDQTHAPVPGVRVDISDEPVQGHLSRTSTALTDSHGQYSLRGWSGDIQLRISAAPNGYAIDQFAPAHDIVVVAGQPLNVDPITIKLGLTASGKVVRKDGKSPANISVSSIRHSGNQAMQSGEAQTKPDGSYVLAGLVAGRYSISVLQAAGNSDDDWSTPNAVTVDITEGKPNVIPDLVLGGVCILTGTVVDAQTKKPIPGVRLGVQDPYIEGQQNRSINFITDVYGKFSAHVWPGALQLYVYDVPKDYANVSSDTQRSFKIAEGQLVALDPIGISRALTVTGIAFDENGKPVPDLSLQPQKGQNDGSWMNIPPVTTGKDGSFTVSQLVPGSYYIDAGASWTVVSPAAFAAPSTGPIRLSLKKSAITTLQGTVVDTAGTPLPGVSITFQTLHSLPNGSMSADNASGTTDATGYFSVTGPYDPRNAQRQSVTKDGYAFRSGGEVTTSGNQISVSLIVMARLGGVVSGIVRNGLNAPVAGAWVACPDGNTDVRPVQTDSAGKFKLNGLVTGTITIFAAKGRYFGQTPANVTTDATDITIDLSPMTATPTPGDTAAGIQMLTTLMSDSAGWNLQGQSSWLRNECAGQIAAYSPNAALSFLQSFGKPNAGDVEPILSALAARNPQEAALWGIPLLGGIDDNGSLGGDAAELGLAVVPYDVKSATTLYGIALKKLNLDHIDNGAVENAARLVALSYALNAPEADGLYKKVQAFVSNASGNDSQWLTQTVIECLVQGNLKIGMQALAALPVNQRGSAAMLAIAKLVRSNPSGAVTLLNTIDKDNPNSSWAYNDGLCHVLPILFKADPKNALASAQAILDPRAQSEALTIAADLTPIADATSIYEQAEAASVDQMGQGSTPASIAAHALLRDPALGAKLFKVAFDKITAVDANNQQGQGPSYAEFAFYYSRIDPGYSRLLVEDQFAKDQVNPPQYGQTLTNDVGAMAAIDPARALEMANSIKNANDRFTARKLIAERAMQDQLTRDTIPFAEWSNGWGWTAGIPTPW
jgi:protocatechuate 3,4-dioxygenase beta subunit